MRCRKSDLALAMKHGGRTVYPDEIARVSRNKRAITLRHAWPDNTDGPVLHRLGQLWRQLARDVARKCAHDVTVYTHDGITLDVVYVEDVIA